LKVSQKRKNGSMSTYGYVRVSTKAQNEERQMIAMEQFGVEMSHIILDKQSGKDFEQPGYRKLLRRLKPGTLLSSKASTGWDATTMIFWNSGGC